MTSRPEPTPELVDAAMEALADALAEEYPHLDFIPLTRGKRLPAGARLLPAAPDDREPLGDIGEARARRRRRNLHAVDE